MMWKAKPIIAYPGAKWKAWNVIRELIPKDIKDWREPFFGGGSTTLLLLNDPAFNIEKAVVGDLAPEIYAFWKGIQESPTEVIAEIKNKFSSFCPSAVAIRGIDKSDRAYGVAYENSILEGREMWKWIKGANTSQMTLVERAARTYIGSKTSFSGLGDAGSMSRDALINKFKMENVDRIIDCHSTLERVEIHNQSFEKTMEDVHKKNTFVFLDPPYYTQEKSGLYGKDGKTHIGFPHKEFARVTGELECRFLVTYDDCIMTRKMFKEFEIQPFQLSYTLAGVRSDDALDGEEIFISNYETGDSQSTEDIMSML